MAEPDSPRQTTMGQEEDQEEKRQETKVSTGEGDGTEQEKKEEGGEVETRAGGDVSHAQHAAPERRSSQSRTSQVQEEDAPLDLSFRSRSESTDSRSATTPVKAAAGRSSRPPSRRSSRATTRASSTSSRLPDDVVDLVLEHSGGAVQEEDDVWQDLVLNTPGQTESSLITTHSPATTTANTSKPKMTEAEEEAVLQQCFARTPAVSGPVDTTTRTDTKTTHSSTVASGGLTEITQEEEDRILHQSYSTTAAKASPNYYSFEHTSGQSTPWQPTTASHAVWASMSLPAQILSLPATPPRPDTPPEDTWMWNYVRIGHRKKKAVREEIHMKRFNLRHELKRRRKGRTHRATSPLNLERVEEKFALTHAQIDEDEQRRTGQLKRSSTDTKKALKQYRNQSPDKVEEWKAQRTKRKADKAARVAEENQEEEAQRFQGRLTRPHASSPPPIKRRKTRQSVSGELAVVTPTPNIELPSPSKQIVYEDGTVRYEAGEAKKNQAARKTKRQVKVVGTKLYEVTWRTLQRFVKKEGCSPLAVNAGGGISVRGDPHYLNIAQRLAAGLPICTVSMRCEVCLSTEANDKFWVQYTEAARKAIYAAKLESLPVYNHVLSVKKRSTPHDDSKRVVQQPTTPIRPDVSTQLFNRFKQLETEYKTTTANNIAFKSKIDPKVVKKLGAEKSYEQASIHDNPILDYKSLLITAPDEPAEQQALTATDRTTTRFTATGESYQEIEPQVGNSEVGGDRDLKPPAAESTALVTGTQVIVSPDAVDSRLSIPGRLEDIMTDTSTIFSSDDEYDDIDAVLQKPWTETERKKMKRPGHVTPSSSSGRGPLSHKSRTARSLIKKAAGHGKRATAPRRRIKRKASLNISYTDNTEDETDQNSSIDSTTPYSFKFNYSQYNLDLAQQFNKGRWFHSIAVRRLSKKLFKTLPIQKKQETYNRFKALANPSNSDIINDSNIFFKSAASWQNFKNQDPEGYAIEHAYLKQREHGIKSFQAFARKFRIQGIKARKAEQRKIPKKVTHSTSTITTHQEGLSTSEHREPSPQSPTTDSQYQLDVQLQTANKARDQEMTEEAHESDDAGSCPDLEKNSESTAHQREGSVSPEIPVQQSSARLIGTVLVKQEKQVKIGEIDTRSYGSSTFTQSVDKFCRLKHEFDSTSITPHTPSPAVTPLPEEGVVRAASQAAVTLRAPPGAAMVMEAVIRRQGLDEIIQHISNPTNRMSCRQRRLFDEEMRGFFNTINTENMSTENQEIITRFNTIWKHIPRRQLTQLREMSDQDYDLHMEESELEQSTTTSQEY